MHCDILPDADRETGCWCLKQLDGTRCKTRDVVDALSSFDFCLSLRLYVKLSTFYQAG
jgi:hypothetical protein